MTLKSAILATLAYHDIFDYPPTFPQIQKLLVGKTSNTNSLRRGLKVLLKDKKIGEKDGYYFLKKRRQIVTTRIKRAKSSRKKLNRAYFYSSALKLVPTIKFVAISGALAMENSDNNDDIDLVVVSSKGSLWTTRFLANLVLWPFKRNPNGAKVSDKACLNLFLDESALKIRDQNIYMAHEICQMLPLWNRQGTYQRFIEANAWIKKYLPNWAVSSQFKVHSSHREKQSTTNLQLSTVETFLEKFQLWYMRPKVTTEKIGGKQLFFHPKRTQGQVLASFHKKIKALRIRTT